MATLIIPNDPKQITIGGVSDIHQYRSLLQKTIASELPTLSVPVSVQIGDVRKTDLRDASGLTVDEVAALVDVVDRFERTWLLMWQY